MDEKLVTRSSGGQYLGKMTREQAQRVGEQRMPADLKKAGFVCVVCRTTYDINGWEGYRINYGRRN